MPRSCRFGQALQGRKCAGYRPDHGAPDELEPVGDGQQIPDKTQEWRQHFERKDRTTEQVERSGDRIAYAEAW